MAQCKISYCREQAIYGGSKWGHKRYCAVHGENYYQKRLDHFHAQKHLPDCASCGNKINRALAEEGSSICRDCKQMRDQAQRVEYLKHQREREFLDADNRERVFDWLQKWAVLKNLEDME